MIVALALAISLMASTSLFHYLVLKWLSGGMARIAVMPGIRVLLIVLVATVTHIIEILLYAGAYALENISLGLGSFGGAAPSEPLDYFYFSIVSYTSLGIGDVVPAGHLRVIAGVEALNGLLLIAWTGSFIYLAMGRLWPWEKCTEPPVE